MGAARTCQPAGLIRPGRQYSQVVPTSERTTRAAGRCETHPGRPASHVCDSCGRALCLTCATPVRGQVLGPECVAPILGTDQEAAQSAPQRRIHPTLIVAGIGSLAAVVGTVLPWSAPNFSHYTGLFGGWGFSPLAWSAVASIAAAGGLGLWIWAVLRGWSARTWILVMAVAASTAAAGSVLFLLWPPFATHPWLGPWATLGGAGTALAGSLGALWLGAGQGRN